MYQVNWEKVSELVLTGIITLVVGLILAYVGYRLGRLQSDISWKREVSVRKREHEEQIKLQELQFNERVRLEQQQFAEQIEFQQKQLHEQKKQWEEEKKTRRKPKGVGPTHWNI